MHLKSVSELTNSLRAKEISSRELTSLYLDRIEEKNPELNAFITVTQEQALKEADRADTLIARGEAGPLTGVPLAHKDLFCTSGIRTSCGSKMLDNFIAPYDATVVERCRYHGMVMVGKTNMDEFAMGSSNENSYYGPVRNPWSLDRVPGGSSGGSAAAVAARLVPLATCTDTGGSIRQPASLSGITGIKPTYGRVSRYGMIAFASSLDQGGAMATSAADAALLLSAMAGFDERDSTSLAQAGERFFDGLEAAISGLRIGLPRQHFGQGLDSQVGACVRAAVDEFQRMGAKIVEVDLENTDLSIPAYYVVAPAEASSNLARYDGVRFGHRAENPQGLEDFYKRSRSEGFGAEVKRRIMIGTYVLSAGYYDAYYLKAQQLRRIIKEDFQRAFEQADVLMGPTSPSVAFRLGEKLDDPVTMYLCDIYTNAVNLAGLPAMSIPAGFAGSMPVGLHIIGNYFDEARLLNVAHRYQQLTDWHTRIPQGFE
ncbi:MAG TPA: Asp-tRNA(Asn)/Glu-tRNA(Gln) amidotransferase subunit GatA [Gammaproteobacteria bacterium]|nr:Asp-tRNA(Asn)/Glu-tRNA(Gln) amidotransferase subunit GatA [Gammaproteobacteria bacterium]